jgi:hypothetical protein
VLAFRAEMGWQASLSENVDRSLCLRWSLYARSAGQRTREHGGDCCHGWECDWIEPSSPSGFDMIDMTALPFV